MVSARWAFVICALCAIGALSPIRPPALAVVAHSATDVSVNATGLTASATVILAVDAPPVRRLVMYFDPRYARGRAMSDRFAAGFGTHEEAVLTGRGPQIPVTVADAPALARLLKEDPRGTCLFVPGGLLPVDVRAPGLDPLPAWLRKGGCVIWMGAPFDAYYAERGTPVLPGCVQGPDTTPWVGLYGPAGPLHIVPDIHSPPQTFGTVSAAVRPAIGLTFDATTFPVDTAALERAGGTPIGYVDSAGRSSISVLPVGNGRVVIFADGDDNELTTAEQIAQILVTGAWYDPRSLRIWAVLGPGSEQIEVRVPPRHHVFAFSDPPYYLPFAR